jgi:hypothetical protein
MSRVRSLVVAIALAASLSACGGSDDGEGEPQAEESVTDASEDVPEPGGGTDPFCGEVDDIIGPHEMPDQDLFAELLDNAPDEISDDFQVLADALSAPQSADQAAVQEAQTNILPWAEDNCG